MPSTRILGFCELSIDLKSCRNVSLANSPSAESGFRARGSGACNYERHPFSPFVCVGLAFGRPHGLSGPVVVYPNCPPSTGFFNPGAYFFHLSWPTYLVVHPVATINVPDGRAPLLQQHFSLLDVHIFVPFAISTRASIIASSERRAVAPQYSPGKVCWSRPGTPTGRNRAIVALVDKRDVRRSRVSVR